LLPGWKQGYSGENVTKIRQLCLVSVLLTSGVASAANVRLQVEGLSGALEKNVRAQLSTIQSDEVTPDRRFRARG
jgi:translocation and assembly module TamA